MSASGPSGPLVFNSAAQKNKSQVHKIDLPDYFITKQHYIMS